MTPVNGLSPDKTESSINAQSPEKAVPWMSTAWQGLRETASHPLVILIVGAILSNYVIPHVTRKWQDHQHVLELKTSLVGQISESSTRALMQMQFRQFMNPNESQRQIDAGYLDWLIKSGMIEAEMEAYFPTTSIGQNWNNAIEIVHRMNSLSFSHSFLNRVDLINYIRRHLRDGQISLQTSQAKIEWRPLVTYSPDKSKYLKSWIELRSQVQVLIDAIIRKIIDTSIVGF